MRRVRLIGELVVLFGGAWLLTSLWQPSDNQDSSARAGIRLGEQRSANITVHKPDKVYSGYTLVPGDGNERVELMDMNGKVVHHWVVDAQRARLLPNGHLLVVHGTKWGNTKPRWDKLRPIAAEYDWDGKVVWKYQAEDIVHHDISRLENGNTLMLRRFMVPDEYKKSVKDPVLRQQPIRSDAVIEVTPQGQIVWEWRAHDYLDLNSCGDKGCRDIKGSADALKRMRDWTHMNTASVVPENHWYREGHTIFKPGNIIVHPRNWWTSFIIDKDTKEIVWKYTGDYRGGVSGGHEPHMIPEGLPGAGNVLMFDNGRKVHSEESFILEINPVTKQVVWVYDVGKKFYSSARGSVQRLRNGNTLISEDKTGRCFEVTREKEIVWELREERELNRCRRYGLDYLTKKL